MWTMCCFSLLTAVLCVLVTECDSETEAEKAERYYTASRWALYPEARVSYYIHDVEEEYKSDFIGVVLHATDIVNSGGCVEMIKVEYRDDASLFIRGVRNGTNNTEHIAHCGGSGQRLANLELNIDVPDIRDYLRGILMCLAPFHYEHQRLDRDEYLEIFWGKHYRWKRR
ncbi:hypothetical protein MTO96_026294 [Rhipicephalus appendiculatus]